MQERDRERPYGKPALAGTLNKIQPSDRQILTRSVCCDRLPPLLNHQAGDCAQSSRQPFLYAANGDYWSKWCRVVGIAANKEFAPSKAAPNNKSVRHGHTPRCQQSINSPRARGIRHVSVRSDSLTLPPVLQDGPHFRTSFDCNVGLISGLAKVVSMRS